MTVKVTFRGEGKHCVNACPQRETLKHLCLLVCAQAWEQITFPLTLDSTCLLCCSIHFAWHVLFWLSVKLTNEESPQKDSLGERRHVTPFFSELYTAPRGFNEMSVMLWWSHVFTRLCLKYSLGVNSTSFYHPSPPRSVTLENCNTDLCDALLRYRNAERCEVIKMKMWSLCDATEP